MKKSKIIILAIEILILISLALSFFLEIEESFRIVFGSVYVLFLPGFIISFIFFPKTKELDSKEENAIDWLERIALSFALSIAIVPLVVFYLNLIGIKINLLNTSLIIAGIMLISIIILWIKQKRQKADIAGKHRRKPKNI